MPPKNANTLHQHIRARDWKLREFFEDNHVEPYSLRDDLSEKHDLAKDMPDRANALRDQPGNAILDVMLKVRAAHGWS